MAQYVSREDSQSLLKTLQQLPGEPRNGFFGPGSVTWQINRESALFLGAGRAALLQLAHPWVASALAQHSNLLHRPVGRFHSTFRVIYTMLYGTRGQAIEAAKQLYRRHTTVRGESTQGEHYEANEIAALLWVHATLVDSAILAYEVALPPLPASDKEQYYTESKRMAALFGIPFSALPGDWAAFGRYMEQMTGSTRLSVDGNALALGKSVLSGAGSWVRLPHWYHALTGFWMPPSLRAGFELPFGTREEEAVQRTVRLLPRLYPYIPHSLRFVGPFHEAEARLRGQPPGLLTRRNNSFWMGQPRMLYAGLSE